MNPKRKTPESQLGCARLQQIRRSHRSARPKPENIAWTHTHADLDFVLKAYDELYLAASCVANMISIGAGGMIQGTLMEKEFRDALNLKPGKLVDIPSAAGKHRHGVDCPKAVHTPDNFHGYLHAADDDGPYAIDSVVYCGRCHCFIGS